MLKKLLACLVFVSATAFGAHTNRVSAAEGAVGFYLLGSTTTNAGVLPPPGSYFIDYNYYYSGSTDFTLDIAGLIVDGGVDANAYYNVATPLWVAPGKVLGGNIAFLMLVPVGWKDVTAGASVEGPGHCASNQSSG